jgi:hypothetical protein
MAHLHICPWVLRLVRSSLRAREGGQARHAPKLWR